MRDPRASCHGKERFGTWSLAQKVGRHRRRAEKNCGAYRCPARGGYHLGELIGKRRRRDQVVREIEA